MSNQIPSQQGPYRPARKRSIIGPMVLVLAGLLGVASVFLPLASAMGTDFTYFTEGVYGSSEATIRGVAFVLLVAFALILILGILAAAARKGPVYIIAGIFAVLGGAIGAIQAFGGMSQASQLGAGGIVGIGVYATAAASVLALVGAVIMFATARRPR